MAVILRMQPTGDTALHPFFNRSSHIDAQREKANDESDTNASASHPTDGVEVAEPSDEAPKGSGKRRKPRQKAHDTSQKTLAQVLNPAGTSEQQPPKLDEDTRPNILPSASDNDKRRKRRRTSEIESRDVGEDEEVVEQSQDERSHDNGEDSIRQRSPLAVVPPSKHEAADESLASKRPPKKMLKLSAGGKLASPKAKKAETGGTPPEPKRRGRPRRAKDPPPPKSLEVCIKYGGSDVEKKTLLGLQLDRILAGVESLARPEATTKKPRTPKKPKNTHPFFNGKPKEQGAPKLESPRKMTATTPGKLRREAMQDRTAETNLPSTFTSTLLKDRLMTRHPGAREAAWPDGDSLHVRSLDGESLPDRVPYERRRLKQKQTRLDLDNEESIIYQFATALRPESEPKVRPDGYSEPRPDLRLPGKLLLSGDEIASRVRPLLQALLPGLRSSEATSSQTTAHPGIQKLWRSLPNHMSGFDHCIGEIQGWAQKFAPTTAHEVLQPSRTMTVLTDWLKALMVNTVSSAPTSNSPPKEKGTKPRKKRRRKDDDMDDFVISDDESVMDVQDVTTEDQSLANDPRLPRSTVQVANGYGKFSNAVLLSGPHGCGKTAAAYAVAKELGYQVFEISSAERRSGRDVLDKVGDMTENHIVRHHGVDPGELSASEDRSRMEAAFQKDLESGRQGKMASFFKAKPAVKKQAPKPKPVKAPMLEKLQKALKKSAKDQQQSLILLEEVDVLFKEDKEFWNTVLKLVATSKRPFIMTCNDEDLVPLQAMSLHAILRLGPPPADLAVDYLLLMAATGGHLLQREAVTSLYESRDRDLRASITELDFWCQMGVGDPKGGLDWIFQRYPPGSDVDDQGQTLRVVSDGSYQTGTGFTDAGFALEEEKLSFVWREYGLQPSDALDNMCDGPARATSQSHPMPGSSASVSQTAKLVDALSAMDVYTTHSMTDSSLPELPEKAHSNYIKGMALLESNHKADYSDMPAKLEVTSAFLAHRVQGNIGGVEEALTTTSLLSSVQRQCRPSDQPITRRDFTCFDPITWPTSTSSSSGLEYSALDGPMSTLTTEIAPYIRSIVQYDLSLEEQRAQLGGFGEPSKSKRARTTRAARSAMEGSRRASTRRERWFDKQLDMQGVLATGGKGWPKTVARAWEVEGGSREGSEVPASSEESVEAVEEDIIYE